MHKACYLLFASLVFFCCLYNTPDAKGQSSDNSPYSRYGIGSLQDQSSVLNFSMGGTGIAYHNDDNFPFFINLKNPASYAYNYIPSFDSTQHIGIKMACFEAGLLDNNLQQASMGTTAKSNNAYLGYVAMSFPVSRHFGAAFGLVPVSSEGYNIVSGNSIDSSKVTSSQQVENQYQGSGGINKVFVGLAYSPFNNSTHSLSIGANVDYLFGYLQNQEDIFYPTNLSAFNTQTVESVNIHDFVFDYGLMYTINILKKTPEKPERNLSLTLAATASASAMIGVNYNLLTVGYMFNGTTQQNIDTLQDSSYSGKIKLPLMFGFGITIKKGDHWTFSADYTQQNWSQYTYFGQSENLSNSSSMGFGIQYVPTKIIGNGVNYFKKIYYRAGFSYSKTYLDLDNSQLNDEYVSLGFGFPIGIRRNIQPLNASVLNIGVQFGQLGTTSNNLIKQNYIKILFGFTFDDQWFIKRKFD